MDVMNVEPYADLISEGAVPLYGIRIVAFIDEAGKKQTTYETEGDAEVADYLAAMEAAKMDLVFSQVAPLYVATEEEDEDDG